MPDSTGKPTTRWWVLWVILVAILAVVRHRLDQVPPREEAAAGGAEAPAETTSGLAASGPGLAVVLYPLLGREGSLADRIDEGATVKLCAALSAEADLPTPGASDKAVPDAWACAASALLVVAKGEGDGDQRPPWLGLEMDEAEAEALTPYLAAEKRLLLVFTAEVPVVGELGGVAPAMSASEKVDPPLTDDD